MTLPPLELAVEYYRHTNYNCVEYDPDPDDLPDAWGHSKRKVNTMMNIITEGVSGNESTGVSSSLSPESLTPSYIPTDPRT